MLIIYLTLFIVLVSLVIFREIETNNSIQKYLDNAEEIVNREIEIKIPEIEESKEIPKNIMQTYSKKEKIPDFIFEKIKEKSKGYKYFFYDNDNCEKFLKENFSQEFSDKFNSFKLGCHKADFFRLAWLYYHGGVYLDIDIELLKDLDYIIKDTSDSLILPKSKSRRLVFEEYRLFNAFMICKKGNKLVKKCLESLMKVNQEDIEENHRCFLLQIMEKSLPEKFDYKLIEKFELLSLRWKIKNNNNEIIANSKYKNYASERGFK